MSGKSFRMCVLTPDTTVFDSNIYSVIFESTGGEIGILAGHEPLVAAVKFGSKIRFKTEGEELDEQELSLMGGFASMKNNCLTITSPLAVPPDLLEETLRSIERAREENKQQELERNLEINRMESALRRMLVKNDVAAYNILKDSSDS